MKDPHLLEAHAQIDELRRATNHLAIEKAGGRRPARSRFRLKPMYTLVILFAVAVMFGWTVSIA